MKKRTVTFVLSMVFALSVVGCGSSSEPKQGAEQKTQQEEQTEQENDVAEENKYSDIIGKEFENDDIYIKVENTEEMFGVSDNEWEKAYGQVTVDQEIPLYCDGGFQIGHIKTGATIDITEHGIYNGDSSAYYRFPNPISEAPFDYLYVSYLDFPVNTFNVETDSSIQEQAELEQEREKEKEEEVDPYQNIVSVLDELVDTEKTYTQEEFEELMSQFFDRIDYITYNPELDTNNTISDTVGLDGGKIKYFLNSIFYHIYGAFGWCEEMSVDVTGTNGNEIDVLIKFTYE